LNLRIVARATLGSLLVVIALLWLADRLWPLPLPKDDLARVVLAEDGTPLWRFADANGVWRYPVAPMRCRRITSMRLLTYEDRWFFQHPGVNPLALGRAPGRTSAAGGCVWRQHLVDAGGAPARSP
jgi:penicillin-binding protein 1C